MKNSAFKMDEINLHEFELFTLLMEECGEVIQAVSKVIRGGKTFIKKDAEKNFLQQLNVEMNDLRIIMEAVYFEMGFEPFDKNSPMSAAKFEKLGKWTNYFSKNEHINNSEDFKDFM